MLTQPLDQWSVTQAALALRLCTKDRKTFCLPTKTESSETSEVFIRKRKNTVCVSRHMGGLRKRVRGFESILWGISFTDLPGSESVSDVSQVITRAHKHFLAEINSSKEAFG